MYKYLYFGGESCRPKYVKKLDGEAPLITDPPTTRLTTLSKRKRREEKNVIHDM